MDQVAIERLEQQIDGEVKSASPVRCSGLRCCSMAMTR